MKPKSSLDGIERFPSILPRSITSLGLYGLAVLALLGANTVSGGTQVLVWTPDITGAPAPAPRVLTVTNVISVAACQSAASRATVFLGLRADGRVVMEGGEGALQPPTTLATAVAVAARYYSAAALQADGRLVTWGGVSRTPPFGLSDVVALAVGNWQTVALRSDGTVAVWGNPNYPAGTNMPPGLNDVVAIASGRYNSLALKADGSVIAWGAVSSLANIVPADATNAIAVAAGWAGAGDQNAVLRSDGTVIAWNDAFSFRPFPGQTNLVDIAAGDNLLLAITQDGKVLGADYGLDGVTNALEISPMDFGPRFVVLAGDGSPVVLHQPANTTGFTGQKLRLVSKIGGTHPLSLQWLKGGLPIPGATNAVLVIENAAATDSGSYQLTVTNSSGGATSRFATLEVVQSAPRVRSIVMQPSTGVSYVGGMATLDADVFGSRPMNFQWQFEGANIPDATNATLYLPGLHPDQAGRYSILVTNSAGFATGGPVRLSVSEVAPWGGNFDSELEVPPSATNVVGVYAGGFHGVALRADGSVSVWGNRPKGSGMLSGGALQPPAGLNNVVSVAAGNYFNVALKSDGRLAGWGGNDFGQLNGLSSLSNIVAVAAGHAHTLALRVDGTVVGVGGNYDGQLDLPANLDDAIAIAASSAISLILRSDGTLVQAGRTYYWGDLLPPPPPPEATNIIAIAAGQYHALALRADGTLFEWGIRNNDAVPRPDLLTNIVAIAAGAHHNLVLNSDGRVVAWGANWLGQADVPTDLHSVISIAAGYSHSYALVGGGPPRVLQQPLSLTGVAGGNARLAVSASGTMPMRYQWRQNGHVIMGATRPVLALDSLSMFDAADYDVIVSNAFGSSTSRLATINVTFAPPSTVSIHLEPTNGVAFLGGSAVLTASSRGSPPFGYQWLFEGQTVLSARGATLQLNDLSFVDSGSYMVRVANPFGMSTSAPVRLSVVQVAAWGGRNAGSDNRVFDVPSSVTNVTALSAGRWHMLALRPDGTVIGWGDPSSGKLPVPASASNLVSVAAGGEFSLGLRRDGTVLVWGDQAHNYGIRNLPPGLTNVVQVAAAYSWALALKANGTVVQWGTYIGGSMKPPPPGLTNVIQISVGERHALGLLRNGTVVAWGGNDLGQLDVPSGLSNVVAIAAGSDNFNMALREDGTVIEWGRDASTPPPEATNLVAIAGGLFHRVGLRDDGRVFSWGFENGGAGQTRVPSDLPPVIAIAAAGDASFAVVPATGEPHIARQPWRQTLFRGQPLQLETQLFPGSSNVTFQWFKNGVELPGETGQVLVREFSSASDTGRYRVVARNSFGMDSSREVEVLVLNLAPVITCPANSVTNAVGSAGAVVNFTVTAADDGGVPPTVTCAPPSGSVFSIGPTTVTCTAMDGESLSSICSFMVTVLVHCNI